MSLQYLFMGIISFAAITFVIIKALRKNMLPPDSDDEGGTPVDTNLPKYDPPSGHGLDYLLTDRLPKDFAPKNKPVKQ
jgi:hypothetical protein